jgi:protein involved in temperature-dependent protein secretion
MDLTIPALYPLTFRHEDEYVRAGFDTDWRADPGGPLRGVGRRVFLVGDAETHLGEWKQLDLRPA